MEQSPWPSLSAPSLQGSLREASLCGETRGAKESCSLRPEKSVHAGPKPCTTTESCHPSEHPHQGCPLAPLPLPHLELYFNLILPLRKLPALRGGGVAHISLHTRPTSLQINPRDVPELLFTMKQVTFIKPCLCVKPSAPTTSLAPPNNLQRQVLSLSPLHR